MADETSFHRGGHVGLRHADRPLGPTVEELVGGNCQRDAVEELGLRDGCGRGDPAVHRVQAVPLARDQAGDSRHVTRIDRVGHGRPGEPVDLHDDQPTSAKGLRSIRRMQEPRGPLAAAQTWTRSPQVLGDAATHPVKLPRAGSGCAAPAAERVHDFARAWEETDRDLHDRHEDLGHRHDRAAGGDEPH